MAETMTMALFALVFSFLAVPTTLRAEPPASPLTVLAASSLTESLQNVASAWESQGNGKVTFSFDSSSKLAKQVEGGVPADIFVSADLDWMDYVDTRNLVAPGSRIVLLGNTLVAVVGLSAPFVPRSAGDLANPAVKHLALAGENVPAGKYARAALRSLGAWDGVKDRVVAGDNVRTTLAWVAGGDADAGIVYATDARTEPKLEIACTFPATSHPPIVYPAAVLQASAHVDDARRLVAYFQSAQAQAIFAAAGFLPAPR